MPIAAGVASALCATIALVIFLVILCRRRRDNKPEAESHRPYGTEMVSARDDAEYAALPSLSGGKETPDNQYANVPADVGYNPLPGTASLSVGATGSVGEYVGLNVGSTMGNSTGPVYDEVPSAVQDPPPDFKTVDKFT